MIVTVTLNAAIDRTLTVPNFAIGFRHKATATLTLPGGKGINVARVVKTLGQPVIATGFAGGRTGDRIVTDLQWEGILCDFVRIEAESRTSTAVLDPTSGAATEINEYGADIAPDERELMFEKVAYLTRAADVVLLAGSLPRNVEPGIYADLITQIKSQGVPVLFDSYGEPLRQGIKAGPDVVFPNQVEAEMVIGHEFGSEEDLVLAPRALRELGAGGAVVTYGRGCTAEFEHEGKIRTFRGRGPEVETVSAVGSGDALVGGFAAKLAEGEGPEVCLRHGLACAAANALRYGAGVLTAEDAERLVAAVQLEEVKVD
ncbi:MAG: 1-phosphofructokinase [Thermoleophilia bacterium]